MYTIPFRDLGQSSQGGFKLFSQYMQDNQLNAQRLGRFIRTTGLPVRVYLEPDALAHAIQYRRDQSDSAESLKIYFDRVKYFPELLKLYKDVGAKVYLDAAHSGWFDYRDQDIEAMAEILNRSGIEHADGITTNVSNRQALGDALSPNTEIHYLTRLLPLLNNKKLDVVVDTSRNGGTNIARQYTLAATNLLFDNEIPSGRFVGVWHQDKESHQYWLVPLFGKSMPMSVLVAKDKYVFNSKEKILSAPPWLDAVGDLKLGPAPQDLKTKSIINKYRYIKPPDDCDGSINCPPGASKSDISKLLQR